MSLFNRFFSRRKSAGVQTTGPPANVRAVRNLSPQSWISRWSWLRGDHTLHNSELIFAAASRISNTLSAMPVQLYSGSRAVHNALNDIVGCTPNGSMTSMQFFKTLEACRRTSGNAYALKRLGSSGELLGFDILDPSRVTPILEDSSGELWYRIAPLAGQEFYVHNFYVLHLPFISTNGIVGVNPVSVLQNTLQYSDSITQFSAEQLSKGINAATVLEAPANLGETQKQKMLASFLALYKNSGGRVLLLESGVTAKALNLSPIDTKIFEVERITRSKVAMVYNIPAHLLNDYSDVSFASQEQQMLEFLMLTMLPIVTAYEQELGRKLLTSAQRRQGFAFKFNMESVLRADAAAQAEVYQKAIRGGWMKPNEVRARYNLQSEKEGNKLLASRDLTTLEYITAHPDKTPPLGADK
jgi:HK97 family phage portal protein